MKVLYEDESLIVCEKPCGILSEEAPLREDNMPYLIREYLNSPGAYIGVVHRLDRETAGIMVYAKTSGCAAALSREIAEGKFKKEYLAVCENSPSERSGIYEDFLFKDSSKNKSFIVKRMRKGVKKASLSYEVLNETVIEEKKLSLIKIQLQTGRTHQIRVQFSGRKMPLLGDIKYGTSFKNCDLALFSCRLSFIHPQTGKTLETEVYPDNKFPWDRFSECFQKEKR